MAPFGRIGLIPSSSKEFPLSQPVYGIVHSNRDLTKESSWGKNQFNNFMPVALLSWMNDNDYTIGEISLTKELEPKNTSRVPSEVFPYLAQQHKDLSYEFEAEADASLVDPSYHLRHDCVVKNFTTRASLAALEIKLTTFPDFSTQNLPREQMGSELVVRPDTIVGIADSVAARNTLAGEALEAVQKVAASVRQAGNDVAAQTKLLPSVHTAVTAILKDAHEQQKPTLVQAIWNTMGEQNETDGVKNFTDIFVWTDSALLHLCLSAKATSLTRSQRSLVWFLLMWDDAVRSKLITPGSVINAFTFSTKTDKAFSVGGKTTNRYLRSARLVAPSVPERVLYNDITDVEHIRYLKPERRLDAWLDSRADLFVLLDDDEDEALGEME
jgi:hypothetical protein